MKLYLPLLPVLAVACGMATPPNIVFILADDLGYSDLACFGAPDIRTPHIDALAKNGVRLTDFYANGSVCTPTRAGFMTGRYQQRIGGLEWAIYPRSRTLGLPPQEKTIASLLRDRGYATALAGKWHLGYLPEQGPNHHGFTHFFGLLSGNHNYFTHCEDNGRPDLYRDMQAIEMKGYSTDLITEHALQFLERMKAGPFFLYVAYNAPHFPIQGPDDEAIPLDKSNWYKGPRSTYVKMVERLDDGVGRIVAALAQHQLIDNTLVVFTSDNGGDPSRCGTNHPLRGGKHTHYEGGIRVPCVAAWPGHLPAGVTSAQVGIMMDWSATMLALAGAAPAPDRPLDGIDLLPVLGGKEPSFDRTLFWRKRGERGKIEERAVRSGPWKYFWWPDGRQELYLLTADIAERQNLAGVRPALVRDLRLRIDAWERDISPPLYNQNPNQFAP